MLGFGTTSLHDHGSWQIGSVVFFVLLSFIIGWLPLKWGLIHLKNFEA